jgi:hypothetical protein
MRAVLFLVAMIVAACTAPVSPDVPAGNFVGVDGKPLVMADGTIDNAVQEALTADPAACAAAGGELQPVCRMQRPMCLISFADAGKACTDGSQCGSGRCYVQGADAAAPTSGQCTATNDPCGCYQRIEDGKVQPTICVD